MAYSTFCAFQGVYIGAGLKCSHSDCRYGEIQEHLG